MKLIAPRLVTKTEDRRGDPKIEAILKKYARDYYHKHKKRLMKAYHDRMRNNSKYREARKRVGRAWLMRNAKDPKFLAKAMWKKAKGRAKTYGFPFNISLDDVIIPTHCPVFGFKLKSALGQRSAGKGKRGVKNTRFNSPCLDKIIPKKGYVKGNIAVISHRANVLKRDASLEEIEKLARWMRRVTR